MYIRSARPDDPDGSATDAAYADALTAAGIDPDRGDPAEPGAPKWPAARRRWPRQLGRGPGPLGGRPPRPRPEGPGRGGSCRRPPQTPDPDRDALRAALLVEDKAERLGRLRPLAERADAGLWASASLVLLGDVLAEAGDVDAGLAVLRRASWAHPEDAPVHYTLGRVLEGGRVRRRRRR